MAPTLPDSAAHHDLSRLNIYAAYIKHLELRTIQPLRDCVQDSAGYLEELVDQNALLPNLESLLIETYKYTGCTLYWVPDLFSSSLLEIRLVVPRHEPSPMTLGMASCWLADIAEICPDLRTLEIYPYCPWAPWDQGVSRRALERARSARDSFHHSLARLTQLRSLYINTFLTEPLDLQAMATMPHLERLDIRSGLQRDVMIGELGPDIIMPSLRHLAMRNLDWEDFHNIYSKSSIGRQLESLYLVLCPIPDPGEHPARFQTLDSWLPLDYISTTFHHLTSLTMIFEFFSSVELQEQDLYCMSELRLEYLLIRGATITSYSNRKTPLELVVEYWPTMKELHLPDQQANQMELAHLAALPDLHHLTLLTLRIAHVLPGRALPPTAYSEVHLVFEVMDMTLNACDHEHLHKLAVFLQSVWPNISLAWPQDSVSESTRPVELMSQMIMNLQNAERSRG